MFYMLNFIGDTEFTCELDECALLVRDLKSSGLIKDHRGGILTKHKNSFIGKEFVDWIVKTKQVGELFSELSCTPCLFFAGGVEVPNSSVYKCQQMSYKFSSKLCINVNDVEKVGKPGSLFLSLIHNMQK